MVLSLLASLFSLLSPHFSASANDSTAALGAGGLTLTESADIRMASEDLSISKDLIRVRYSFVNESDKPITTRVAFPLPVVDLDALGESDVGWPTDNLKNPVDFKVTVAGDGTTNPTFSPGKANHAEKVNPISVLRSQPHRHRGGGFT